MTLPPASGIPRQPLSSAPAAAASATVRRLAVSDISARDLNSALRIVYFSHPRDKEIERSDKKIDKAPLPESTRQALKINIRGSLGIARRDRRSFAGLRSSRLTSGQVARDKMAHIDRMLAGGTSFVLQDKDSESNAVLVSDLRLSEPHKAELARYKEVLAFYSKTTTFDGTLSAKDIRHCLDRTGFCAIHDNVKGDGHSQAILLIRTPAQIMVLNQLHEDFRPVDEAQELVGGETLQQNRLFFARTAEQFGKAQEVIVDDYNAGASLFSSKAVEQFATPADETKHTPALYNRQFTVAPSGYGCSFKTTSDMEEAILSSDLKSRMQKHVEALACLAMKEKNLSFDQPIPEEQVWSSSDFPHKAGAIPVAPDPAPINIRNWPHKPG